MAEGTNMPDFGAYAFGLLSIKRDVSFQLGESDELNRYYEGTVQWYVDCFAKDFPESFDADAFKRDAGLQVTPPTCPECGQPVQS